MKKSIFIIIVSILSIVSCVSKHYDAIETFKIEGTVYCSEGSKPLSNVRILFNDKGYDASRENKNLLIPIGHSDLNGKIDQKFEYFWGRSEGLFHSDPLKNFDIVLQKEEYKEVAFPFSGLNQSRTIYIELKTIYMEKI